MIAFVRVVLLLLLALVLVGVLAGIVAATTGPLEKLVFAGVVVLVLVAASRVHRLGHRRA
jgi:hypothetical protein